MHISGTRNEKKWNAQLLDVTDGTGFMNGESFFSIGIEGSAEFFIGLSGVGRLMTKMK